MHQHFQQLGSDDPDVREAALEAYAGALHTVSDYTDDHFAAFEGLFAGSPMQASYGLLAVAMLLHDRVDGRTHIPAGPVYAICAEALAWWARSGHDGLPAYTPATGWYHSVAHGTEVVIALARQPDVPPEIVDLIATAYAANLTSPFRFDGGEEERMALAALVLRGRSDFGLDETFPGLSRIRIDALPDGPDWVPLANAKDVVHAAIALALCGVRIDQLGVRIPALDGGIPDDLREAAQAVDSLGLVTPQSATS